jgi:hypothetical protein
MVKIHQWFGHASCPQMPDAHAMQTFNTTKQLTRCASTEVSELFHAIKNLFLAAKLPGRSSILFSAGLANPKSEFLLTLVTGIGR